MEQRSSIIERPWSEEAFRDFRSGPNYEQNRPSDSFVNSEAEEAFRDFGSKTKYGTSSEQSNQTDSSTSSTGTKSEKTHAGGQHECMDMFPATKGETISPFYMIICDICGEDMDNDLICPRCEREMPGHLIHNVCEYCDDYPAGHKSDSCPRKNNPVYYEFPSSSEDESDDIALMSDYEPSSP